VASNLKNFIKGKISSGSATEFSGKIERPKMILVEGVDDLNFIAHFLKYQNIENVQILNIGGEGNFEEQLEVIYLQNSSNILNSLAIFRDADGKEPLKVFNDLAKIVTKIGWTCPKIIESFSKGTPKIGIFIIPNKEEGGTLEHLFLKTVEDSPYLTCVGDFYSEIEVIRERLEINIKGIKDNREAKIKAASLLLTTKRYDTRVGLAAENGYWNLDHPCLDSIKQFLSKL
jgi:hypothetical protein